MRRPARLAALWRGDLVRDGSILFVATMTLNAANYAYHFFVSRAIGVEAYGALAALVALVTIAIIPVQVATNVVVTFAAEFRAADDFARLHALVRTALRYGVVIAAGAIVAGIALALPLAAFLHLHTGWPIVLTAGIIAGYYLLPGVRGVLQGMQDFRGFGVSAIFEGVGKAVLGVGLALAGFGLAGALAGYGIGIVLDWLVTWRLVVAHRLPEPAPLAIDARRIARTTAGFLTATGCITLLTYGDVILARHFLTPRDAGLYSAVALSGKILIFLVAFVPMVILPKAADAHARGESPLPLLLRAGAFVVIAGLCVLALFALAPSLVIRGLVGGAFAQASGYVVAYGAAMILLSATQLVGTYKVAIRRFDFVIPVAVVTVAEFAAIALFHDGIGAIVRDVLAGDALAFAVCLRRLTA